MTNHKIQISGVGLAVGLSLIAALAVALLTDIGGAAADSSAAEEAVAVSESPRPLFVGDPGPGTSKFGALKPATTSALEALPDGVGTVLANLPQDPAREPSAGGEHPNPIGGTVGAVASLPSAVGTSDIGFAEVNGALCLFAAGAEYQGAAIGSCPSLEQAEEGRGFVVIPDLSPDSVRVVGIAPDGVNRIGVDRGGDGAIDQTVPVASNLYQVDLPPTPSEIVGIAKSGQHSFQVPVPLDRLAAPGGN